MEQLSLFDYQSRFQAFLDYKNAVDHTEVNMYEFIVWIGGHVETFKRMYDIQTLQGMHNEFTDYLWEQVNG
ncbi:hypothetical protein [Salinicoccus albus]|uniref:hypothetical protein n=1 Tax=Salinicoccus albus TaxID=418756 RepID=UPI000370DCD4|nr:hypothetical protein [Salinicoccus albus]